MQTQIRLKYHLGLYVNIWSLKLVSEACQLNPYTEPIALFVIDDVLYHFLYS